MPRAQTRRERKIRKPKAIAADFNIRYLFAKLSEMQNMDFEEENNE
jgi:hypothetical protein